MRLIIGLCILVSLMSTGIIAAQDEYDPLDKNQVLARILTALDTAPPEIASWSQTDGTPEMPGSSITFFAADSWRIRLMAPVTPFPEYSVLAHNTTSPDIWIGTVSSDGTVSGEWRSIEADILNALGADIDTLERVYLSFDNATASQAGLFPAFATVAYQGDSVNWILWYDAALPYFAAEIRDDSEVVIYTLSADEAGDLHSQAFTSEATQSPAQVQHTDIIAVNEAMQAVRVFVDYTGSCNQFAPLAIEGTDIQITVSIPENTTYCVEYTQAFEIILLLPAGDITLNSQPLTAE